MVVMWTIPLNSTSTKGYIVEYGTDETLKSYASASYSTYTLQTYTSPIIFQATMTGLAVGNSIYYYRVGSPIQGYSEVYSFKTNPGVGNFPVAFHILGDVGQTSNSLTTFEQIQKQERSLSNSTLSGGIISMGDLSYANGNEPLWDSFGIMRQFVVAEIPFASTVGNHEWFDSANYDFTAYLARFYNPPVKGGKRELYYSFDVGLAHWIMVSGYCEEMRSTATQPCLAEGSPQLDWLTNDLANVDRKITPWVFVVFHEPYMNSNTAHSIQTEGKPLQDAIEDTLYAGKVDLVMSGHVHAYERSCQVYKDVCTEGAPYYITIGDGGNKEGLASTWVNPQPQWSMFRQASYGFGELLVLNATHTKWSWHQNADLTPVSVDELFFVKGQYAVQEEQVTMLPVFADNERGMRARDFDMKAKKR